MIKTVLNAIKSFFNNPAALAVICLLLAFIAGAFVGVTSENKAHQLAITNLKLEQLVEKNEQIEAHNAVLSKVFNESLKDRERADKAEFSLLQAQQDLSTKTKQTQKKVIEYVEKDNSHCPAFDSDGLRLYTEALGYPDDNRKASEASTSSIEN